MNEIIGDYEPFIAAAQGMIGQHGIAVDELTQCDMVNYECSTNERYDQVRSALLQSAMLVSEIEHGGRLIGIFQANPALEAGSWRVPYIELMQPKPTRENLDGIDSIFFVTAVALPEFLKRHDDIEFETKGLANTANPYVELKADEIAVKFHDRHMGAVLEIEKLLETK